MERLPVPRIGVKSPLNQENSSRMQQLQGQIVIQRHFIHVSVLNYNFLPQKFTHFIFMQVPEKLII
jgi:hypothetical protein